jgi:hypothetical protein
MSRLNRITARRSTLPLQNIDHLPNNGVLLTTRLCDNERHANANRDRLYLIDIQTYFGG